MEHSFDIDVAKEYGILEAVILKHIYYWVHKNELNDKNCFDGKYWTYNSVQAFKEIFPYAGESKIKTALNHLKENGLIETGNYNKVAYDRTTWYTITEKGLKVLKIAISQKSPIECEEIANRLVENSQPIPYINTYIETYNNICTNLPKIVKVTKQRENKIRILHKSYSVEDFKKICELANSNAFLTGQNSQGWKADFDFLIREDKATSILEGKYTNLNNTPSAPQQEVEETPEERAARLERNMQLWNSL